jgi:ABC-type multidrug transport system ATPase subunit
MSLQLLSVTRNFGGQRALDAVSLHVRTGDCYGLIGHNGAGKTSALRVALGLLAPDAGRVLVDGFDARVHVREAHARMGGLIETPGFHAHMDAASNLFLLARLRGSGRAEARKEGARLLGLVGLEDVGTKPVHAFSQGMRQRLGIAQALLGSPSLVLLDEPTNGLDPEGSAEVRALLARLVREERLSVLISSHQLHELTELCNRIGVMQRGRLVAEAETGALLATAPGRFEGRFELATDDDARATRALAELGLVARPLAAGGLALELGTRAPGAVARHLVGAGLELVRLGVRPPSLEEIYLRFARGESWDGAAAGATQTAPSELTATVPGEPLRAPRQALTRVLRYELGRSLARGRVPALLALPAVVASLSIVLEKGRVAAEAARVAEGQLASTTAVTGFGACAEALQTGLPLLVVVVVALASQELAGELARGTLRNVLLGPQTRLDVVLGKLLAGAILTLAGYLVLVGLVLAVSAAAFGFGDLVEILPNGQEFPLVTAAELRAELVRALAVPPAALLGCLGLGFLAGAWVRSAAGALGLALGALLAVDLARAAARGLGVEGWLLTAYLPTPLGDTSYVQYFADRAQGISNAFFTLDVSLAGVPLDLACPLLWAVVCAVLSAILLARRAVP